MNKIIRIKNLSYNKKYWAGRNNTGRITVRHRGGRHKRIYRMIDYKRNLNKYSIWYSLNKEYDPNRKSNILRVYSNNFNINYINNCDNIKNHKFYNKYINLDYKYDLNDNLFLKNIPSGSEIFNIQPSNLIKSAGTYGVLLSFFRKENKCRVKLPSKKIVYLDSNFTASIGKNDNVDHNLRVLGKAGVKRWLGIRPTVKGNAMNAVDHPHGGNTKGGNPAPKTKWGKKAKWTKTKNKKK